MKEMVAGCCVCSDERGWTENPLVYCDGIGCNIGVHQACYGIVSVPDGNWYCKKCESQERSARVRCELCPSKDGALKRTDTGGWAHVVCGLYIPEVRFGSVTTMEPIVLSQIPTERYNKVCYICEQNNRGSKASMGACMQCNKAGCKQQFHVTCAQAMGLLCEEAGNYLDNVKYCGYCQEHYSKLKKGANVKTIPAYRPLSSNNSGSEDSPEKKLPSHHNQSPSDPKQVTKRKSSSNRQASQNGPPRATPADKKEILADHPNGSLNPNLPPSSTACHSKNDNSSRFTTSNFVESVITPSESVFADMQKSKKRKLNEQQSSLSLNMSSSDLLDHVTKPTPLNLDDANGEDDDNGEDTPLKFIEEPNLSTLRTETSKAASPVSLNPSLSVCLAPVTNVTTVIYSSSSTTSVSNSCSVLPSASSSSTFTNPVSSSYLTSSASFADVKTIKSDNHTDKGRSKQKRSINTTSSTKKGNKSSNCDQDSSSVNGPTDSSSFASNSANLLYSERTFPSQSSLSVKSETEAFNTATPAVTTAESKESPPTSPENSSVNKPSIKNEERPEKEMKTFQSGSSAPHMLGNQLNPASSMAQKMSDALTDELEAHSIFTTADVNSGANNFVGPPLYNKIISSTRASDSSKRSNSPSNGPLASLSGSAANFPQSLEELLETQWEQGGTFLMEQAQHFDIASLLTCLHKLREENLGLEEHIRKLKARRDHLLGVNARLAMPLAPISQPVNNVHTPSQTPPQQQQQHQQQPQLQQQPQQQQQQQQQQQHSSPILQGIAQQPPSQLHHGQQISHISPPSQLQQVSLSSQPKQSSNSSISSLPPGISEQSSSMRNAQLPSAGMYAASCSTSSTLRGPHGAVYQNPHSMENGLLSNPTHHQQQHSRNLSGQANPGAVRHHSSASNASLYGNSQPVSNPGVVVRTPNLSDVSRTDRRNTSVVSTNYQPTYQIASLPHQQQMAMHREDAYHAVHAKPN